MTTDRATVYQEALAAATVKWEVLAPFKAAVEREANPCATCTTAGCCKQLALCTLFEAVLIAERLAKRSDDVAVNLMRQGARQMKVADAAGCIENPHQFGELISGPWFDLNEYCALYQNGRCLVYDDRPMTCASYFVKSEPEDCEPPSGKRVAAADNTRLLAQVMLLDAKFCQAVGLEPQAPLPIGMQVLTVVQWQVRQ